MHKLGFIYYVCKLTVKCPDIEAPSSGNVTMTTDGSLTTAMFYCNHGYYLDGEVSLICGIDGTWSNDSPSCCEFFYFSRFSDFILFS